jgi:hypothetical protein
MSVQTVVPWLEFVDSVPSSADGSTSPNMPSTSVYGQYAQKLRDDVFHFLVVTLPEVLEVTRPQQDSSSSGRDALLQIYARVPFEMFRAAVESPTFSIGMFFFSSKIICPNVLQELTKRDSNLPRMRSSYASEASLVGLRRLSSWHLGRVALVVALFMLHARCESGRYGR